MSIFGGKSSLNQTRPENIRERKPKSVQKEDYLMKQIDEFREKAKQLQTMLTSREDKISELEEVVTER